MPDDPGVYRLLQFQPPSAPPGRPYTDGSLRSMPCGMTDTCAVRQCTTPVGILCLLDGEQFNLSRSKNGPNSSYSPLFILCSQFHRKTSFCVLGCGETTKDSTAKVLPFVLPLPWDKLSHLCPELSVHQPLPEKSQNSDIHPRCGFYHFFSSIISYRQPKASDSPPMRSIRPSSTASSP